MDTPTAGLNGTIEARLVPESERMQTLPRHFGRHMQTVEHHIFSFMHMLASEYRGGYAHSLVIETLAAIADLFFSGRPVSLADFSGERDNDVPYIEGHAFAEPSIISRQRKLRRVKRCVRCERDWV